MDGKSIRTLVTGATGFIGRHLVALLSWKGYQVSALCMPDDPLRDVLPAEVECWEADLADAAGVGQAISAAQPQVLFHLAGLVRSNNLEQLLNVNVLGTENVLRAAGQLPHLPRVVIPGSAAAVGLANRPINEQTPMRPLSPYGVSKAAQILISQTCFRSRGLPVVIGQIFNLTGPGEPPTMLCGAIASQIVACEFWRAAASTAGWQPDTDAGLPGRTRRGACLVAAVHARPAGGSAQYLQRKRMAC